MDNHADAQQERLVKDQDALANVKMINFWMMMETVTLVEPIRLLLEEDVSVQLDIH